MERLLWMVECIVVLIFFFNDTATTEIYTFLHTLSLHDALPILQGVSRGLAKVLAGTGVTVNTILPGPTRTEGAIAMIGKMAADRGVSPSEMEARSEEHTSELQSLMRSSYAVFCLQKKMNQHPTEPHVILANHSLTDAQQP